MEVRIKKHGQEFDSFKPNRPIRIILNNGTEFEIHEAFNGLVVNLCDGSLQINPEFSNQVSLKPSEPEN